MPAESRDVLEFLFRKVTDADFVEGAVAVGGF